MNLHARASIKKGRPITGRDISVEQKECLKKQLAEMVANWQLSQRQAIPRKKWGHLALSIAMSEAGYHVPRQTIDRICSPVLHGQRQVSHETMMVVGDALMACS